MGRGDVGHEAVDTAEGTPSWKLVTGSVTQRRGTVTGEMGTDGPSSVDRQSDKKVTIHLCEVLQVRSFEVEMHDYAGPSLLSQDLRDACRKDTITQRQDD